MVIFMPDTIYVMELKVGDTLTDGRQVVKVGIRFDADKHTVDEWVVDTGNVG